MSGRPWDVFERSAPLESELVRVGPLEIESIRGRHSVIRFYSGSPAPIDYWVTSDSFNDGVDIFAVIKTQRSIGQAQAHLWVRTLNGRQSLWKADIGDVNVLSFETAKRLQYAADEVRQGDITLTIVTVILLFSTFIPWKKLQRWMHRDG